MKENVDCAQAIRQECVQRTGKQVVEVPVSHNLEQTLGIRKCFFGADRFVLSTVSNGRS